jgi:GT2 family glycosyltransferase
VRLGENQGYSAALNAGIKASSGDFVVLLNNDTRAEPEFLAELHAAVIADEAAMAAPKMLFARDSRVINSIGLGYCISGTNHDIGFGRMDGPEFSESQWIFGPCGGAGMYRRTVLEDVGSFDEDFFMYYEDVDFSFRAQLAGYRCISVPSAKVYHLEGASVGTLPQPRNYYLARNAFAVIVKNYPRHLLIRYAHVLLWEIIKRAGSPMVHGDFSAILGYFAGFRHLRRALNKRREVQKGKKVADEHIEDLLKKNLSILKEIDLQGRPVEETS